MMPIVEKTYSLKQVLAELELRDSPSLIVFYDGRSGAVQDAHITVSELLRIANAATSRWRYVQTTREWIPIFHYVGSIDDLLLWVDITHSVDDERFLWITPRGYPREQEL